MSVNICRKKKYAKQFSEKDVEVSFTSLSVPDNYLLIILNLVQLTRIYEVYKNHVFFVRY